MFANQVNQLRSSCDLAFTKWGRQPVGHCIKRSNHPLALRKH